MAIKVLTTRKFRKGTIEEAYQLLALLRAAGTVRSGYISGLTLTSAEDPHILLVISSWTNRESWEAWLSSEKRKEISTKIAGLLETTEHVAVFHVERNEYERGHGVKPNCTGRSIKHYLIVNSHPYGGTFKHPETPPEA